MAPHMPPKVSATIICVNEEEHIRECLQSVAWCDEIVVVDSGSTDKTVEIAKGFTPKVLHRKWTGFIDQVNYILQQATGDWVLCVDADERCTPELKDAIQKLLAGTPSDGGYELKRHTWYMGRWIDHGGWYPDWKCRFVKREGTQCVGHEQHYRLVPQGSIGRLDADLQHFTYDNFKDQLRTVDKYSDVVAVDWQQKGKRFGVLKAIFHSWGKFIGCYFLKLGILDGWAGLVIAVTSAFYVFAKYVKLAEREDPSLTQRPRT
jgi:glycosyltransferase involved in cell wall biosynthesis